jgi:hypothetical protein
MTGTRALLTTLALAAAATAAQAQLIRPDSAVAGSTFNSNYDIGNAIDGSGLPAGFTLASLHANYAVNNHWTTQNGAIAAGTAWAEFSFLAPQTLGEFHLWNHRSNVIASNSFYAVTQFDLILEDASGAVLASVLDVPAIGGLGTGAVQSFSFPQVANVSTVRFVIDANSTPPGHAGVNYTGVAEVAFGVGVVPEPGTWAMLAAGLVLLGGAVRRRAAAPR